MKNMLKRIAVIMSAILIFAVSVHAGAEENKTAAARGILSGLELIDDQMLENSENTRITRFDFTVLLTKCMGVDPNTAESSGAQYFYDVNPSDENAGYIEYAYKKGITRGVDEGIFGATRKITLKEALVMCTRALDYDITMPENADSENFSTVGASLGLNDGINKSLSEQMTYDDAFLMLYNCMTTDFPKIYDCSGIRANRRENDTNYIESYFDLKAVSGIVESTPYEAPSANEYTGEGYVKIGGMDFKAGKTNAEERMGYRVKAYYRENDDENTLVWLDESYTKSINMPVSSVVSYEPLELKYIDANDREKEYKISSDAYTLVNGSVYYMTGKYNLPLSGFFEIIDNNSDGKYDVVKIKQYDTVVLGGVNAEEKKLYDARESKNIIDLSDYDYCFVKNSDGNTIAFDTISAGSIGQIAKNADKRYVEVTVIDRTESFTVAEISTSPLGNCTKLIKSKENGAGYNINGIYSEIKGNSEIKAGSNYTFMFNIHGEIAASVITSGNLSYGYLKSFSEKNNHEEAMVRIFTTDGEFKTFELADKIKLYDGAAVITEKSEKIGTALKNLSIPALIRYSVNTAGKVNVLEFSGEISNGNGFRIVGEADGKSYGARYKSGTKSIAGRIIMDSSSVLFAVPDDSSEEEKYYCLNVNAMVSDEYYPGAKGYTADENGMVAQAVVLSEDSIDNSEIYFIYEKSINVYDEDNDSEETAIVGYVNGSRVQYTLDDSEAFKFKYGNTEYNYGEGDFLEIYLNRNGKVITSKIKNHFSSELECVPTGTTYPTGLGTITRFDTGLITSIYGGYMQIKNDKDTSGNKTTGEYYLLDDSVKYYVLDPDEKTGNKLTVGGKLDMYANDANRAFIYTKGSKPEAVILIKH